MNTRILLLVGLLLAGLAVACSSDNGELEALREEQQALQERIQELESWISQAEAEVITRDQVCSEREDYLFSGYWGEVWESASYDEFLDLPLSQMLGADLVDTIEFEVHFTLNEIAECDEDVSDLLDRHLS